MFQITFNLYHNFGFIVIISIVLVIISSSELTSCLIFAYNLFYYWLMLKYVIISPVRNEEDFLAKTIHSVVSQKILPAEWIIVNDGSNDKTEEIIRESMDRYSWIKLINLEDRGYYFPGTGVVQVVQRGFEQIQTLDWDLLVKLDCDLEFENDYFESLFLEFEKNPSLGIASGCTYKPLNGKLIRETAQPDHPFGASKVYRRECWNEIGGILPVPGWDLADMLQAQMMGWETRCFFELKLAHFRPGGSRRRGLLRPKFIQGSYEYRHGYSFFFTLFKAGYNLFSQPMIFGSITKVSGYIYAFIIGKPYIFDPEMRKYLRKKHRKFLIQKINPVCFFQ